MLRMEQLRHRGPCAFHHVRGKENLQSPRMDAQGFPTADPLRSGITTWLPLGLSTLQMNAPLPAPDAGETGATTTLPWRRHRWPNNHGMTSWDTAGFCGSLPNCQAHLTRWEVARQAGVLDSSPASKALLRDAQGSYSGSGLVNNRVCVPESTPDFGRRQQAIWHPINSG